MFKIFSDISFKRQVLKGEGHPKQKNSMFCALFQNYQHCFEKRYMHPQANCLRNSKIALQFQ